MIQISPYSYFISDGEVMEAGASVKGTGIKAELQLMTHAGITTQAFCLKGADQFNEALKEFKKAYPNALLAVVDDASEHGGSFPRIGGLATSNAWIKVYGNTSTVLVHPLMVRLRAKKGTLRELDVELSSAGVLADIL